MSATEKTWWLQTKEDPDRLVRVRLISRHDGWVCVETVGMIKCKTGAYFAAYALKVSEFDRTWRKWKIMPTMAMMKSDWMGRVPKNAGAGGV
ncbi:MAG: hypothetical protein IKH57_21310 [Clostridia bacterium]|nr:hypothetical protein [Clostridia bacterium]